MRNHLTALLLFLITLANLKGQEHTFNLEKEKINFDVSPKYKSLFFNINHPIEITTDADSLRYELAGGEFITTDSGSFLKPLSDHEVILNVYDRENRLVFVKNYRVLPEIRPMLAGAYSDSALFDVHILSNRIIGKSRGIKPFRVKSFKVTTNKRHEIQGDKLKGQAKIDATKFQDGRLVVFSDITIEIFKGIETRLEPFRVTYIRTTELRPTVIGM